MLASHSIVQHQTPAQICPSQLLPADQADQTASPPSSAHSSSSEQPRNLSATVPSLALSLSAADKENVWHTAQVIYNEWSNDGHIATVEHRPKRQRLDRSASASAAAAAKNSGMQRRVSSAHGGVGVIGMLPANMPGNNLNLSPTAAGPGALGLPPPGASAASAPGASQHQQAQQQQQQQQHHAAAVMNGVPSMSPQHPSPLSIQLHQQHNQHQHQQLFFPTSSPIDSTNPPPPSLSPQHEIQRAHSVSGGQPHEDSFYNPRVLGSYPSRRLSRRSTVHTEFDHQVALSAINCGPSGLQHHPGTPTPTMNQVPLPPPSSSGSGQLQPSSAGGGPITMVRAPSSSHGAAASQPDEDPIQPFIEGLAQASESPQRQQMWTELIRLKTKSLELQIAEARAKERAAELELLRLNQVAGPFQQAAARANVNATTAASSAAGPSTNAAQNAANANSAAAAAAPQSSTVPERAPVMQHRASWQGQFPPFPVLNGQQADALVTPKVEPGLIAPMPVHPGVASTMSSHHESSHHPGSTPMTPFDLEAMLQQDNLDNLFSWLPDTSNGTAAPDGFLPNTAPSNLIIPPGNDMMMLQNGNGTRGVDGVMPVTPVSPKGKRPLSPEDSDLSPPAPAPKRGKPRGEKKMVIEQHSNCLTCGKAVARVLLRAPKSSIPSPIHVEFRCPDCSGVHQPVMFDPNSTTAGSSIGSTEARKRMRTAMEDDDLVNDDVTQRRCFCDVCQRVVAAGQVVGGPERSSLSHMAEIICTSCDNKYQRCTDCGGGGGPRVGIGKWRLKQVFQPGRKTCSLSHSRLGDRPREIGVHVTPTDFTPEQLKEVLARCKTLWTEKTLARLAVPEMLEIDLPPHLINPLRNFADVDDIVQRCWPSREAMIRGDGIDQNRFKRLLGLTWAHSRPRRTVRTVDLEEEYARQADAEEDDMSTVLANIKKTNVVIPAGSELIGMWGGEWDMQHGSLLISTLIPFEGTDGEDSTALSVGELISKVQEQQQEINTKRTEEASKLGREPDLVRPCEHLWVVSGGSMPLIRERMADILVRKRSFVHVEEYLTRHPDFLHALQARPVGLHPDSHRPLPHQVQDDYVPPNPLILVRWLGKDFDSQRILEIKQMEFGGGKNKKAKKRLERRA